MFIKDIFAQKKPVVSFEVFPPNNKTKITSIYQTIDKLARSNPDYISVTYGASGQQEGNNNTIDLAAFIKQEYKIEALAHLTCITSTKGKIRDVLNKMEDNQIKNVLALRGDLPPTVKLEDLSAQPFQHASDLIRFIREEKSFSIGAACHPEGHPEAKSKTMDLIRLKQKVDSGVDFLVSQLFFDNNDFYNFAKEVRLLGIDIPITAGIMPVVNKRQIERIVELCGARVPAKFQRIMDKYEHNPEALRDAGIAYASEQIIDLLSSGIDGVHLYVMNQPQIAERLVKNISSVVKVLSKRPKELNSAD